MVSLREHYGQCSRVRPPLLIPAARAVVGDEEALAHVRELTSTNTGVLDVAEIVQSDVPVLIGGVWPAALDWTWSRLRSVLAGHSLHGVVMDEYHYLPTDAKAALTPLLSIATHSTRNLSAEAFIDSLAAGAARCADKDACASWSERYARRRTWRDASASPIGATMRQPTLHFDVVPAALRRELQPQKPLYATDFDASEALQYVWLSAAAVRTHTHFDSDRNIFVQLVGRKRFVLWAPNQTSHLCPYARLHPLWHKSRVAFEAPDLERCPDYARAEALTVDVLPGHILYVPPFWWHTVETVTPSLSLSTLSRWPQVSQSLYSLALAAMV